MSADEPDHNSSAHDAETVPCTVVPPPDSNPHLKSGRIIDGNYFLIKQLGKGGMGEAWKALDKTAGRNVVLKFISEKFQGVAEVDETVRSSFKKIHALQHQHICPCHGLALDTENGLYTIMKFVDGITLDVYRKQVMNELKAANNLFPFNDAVQIFSEVADALDYAHSKKVMHRDIKPQNIMISPTDGVQIIDFGLAEEIRETLVRFSQVEMDIAGTRYYMAPEQWKGKYQDARTDQYALAVTVYETISGRLPFFCTDMTVLRECVLNEAPEPISGLPDYTNAVIFRALSKKREDRFENCKAFIAALATKPQTAGISQPQPVPQRYVSRFAFPEKLEPNEMKPRSSSANNGKSDANSSGVTPKEMTEDKPATTPPPVKVETKENSPFVFIAVLNAAVVILGLVALWWFNPFAKPVHEPETNVTQLSEQTKPVQESAPSAAEPPEQMPTITPEPSVTQLPEQTQQTQPVVPEPSAVKPAEQTPPIQTSEPSAAKPPEPAKSKPGAELLAQGWKEVTDLNTLVPIPQTGDTASHHWYLVKNTASVVYEKTENNRWKLNVRNRGLSSGLYLKSQVFEGGIDTVTIKMRADKDANIRVALYDSEDMLGLAAPEKVVLLREQLTTQWQTFSFLLAPKKGQDVMRITGLSSGMSYEIEVVDWKPSPKSKPINKQKTEQKNYDTTDPIKGFKP